jgi:hypothetical protein
LWTKRFRVAAIIGPNANRGRSARRRRAGARGGAAVAKSGWGVKRAGDGTGRRGFAPEGQNLGAGGPWHRVQCWALKGRGGVRIAGGLGNGRGIVRNRMERKISAGVGPNLTK